MRIKMQTELCPTECARQFSIAARFFGGFSYERRGKYAVPARRFFGMREAVFTKDGCFFGAAASAAWQSAQAACAAQGYVLQKERALLLFLPQAAPAVPKETKELCLALRCGCGIANETPLSLPHACAPYAAYGIVQNGRICALAACNTPRRRDGFVQIGVYTVPAARSKGLGAACIASLCGAVAAAGEVPVFRTEMQNHAAAAAAAAAGLVFAGTEHMLLYRRAEAQ